MRYALIVATLVVGFGATTASARPVNHGSVVAKVTGTHTKHAKSHGHSKHRPHGHHHNHK